MRLWDLLYFLFVGDKRFFWLIVALGLIGLLLFAGKNPFSSGSIIPNLEPYPDTLYYSTPAWNFVHGHGFTMSFEGHNVDIITPPLYSIYLIPFFAVFNDVRTFYFANMLLMIASVVLFFLICKKIFGQDLFGTILTGFLGFFFITNFYVYTLPTLLLAENITFFLLAYSIYLLVSKPGKMTNIAVGTIGVLLLWIKLSNLPITIALYLLYLLKIFKNKKDLIPFLIYSLVLGGLFSFYYHFAQSKSGTIDEIITVTFGPNYFQDHFTFYLKTLLGGENIFLWFRERMLAPLIGIISALGIFLGLYHKKSRQAAFQMTILIFSSILFMAFFYVVDTRYIFAIYPAMLVLTGLAIAALRNMLSQKRTLLLMIVVAAFVLFIPNQGQKTDEVMAMTLAKKAVGNIKGNETAWYYVAVTEFNKFFAQKQDNVYLGTFLPPFLLDFYANGNYKYLPLSKEQDFFSAKGGLSKKLKIDDIQTFYTRLLKEGKQVYVSNVYAGNLQTWVKEFEALKTRFELKLVHRGCLDSCNIYKIELK